MFFFRKRQAKRPPPCVRPRRHKLEALETRALLTTTITSLADSGAGTLRAALTTGGNINFQAGLNGTITLASPLTIGSNASIDATGNTISISGANAVRDLNVSTGVTATLTNLTITSGNPGGSNDGGAIKNQGTLTLAGCTISNNTAADGGGIMNDGALTATGCTFSGNHADAVSGYGGALWTFANASATVSSSTFNGNSSAFGAASEYDSANTGQFTNDTFYNNTASGSQTGVVEADAAVAQIVLTNCTIAGNTSGDAQSGAVSAYNGTVKFVNTISANNTVRQFVANNGGTLISFGHNLSSDGTGNLTAAGDLPNANPLLGPLANYGGLISTLALLPGSPAIDAGNTALAPVQDARGISRVGTADIGAFESRGFTLTATSGSGQTVNVGATFAAVTATVVSAYSEPVQNGHVTFSDPGSGPSATFSGSPATINASGQVTITPQANMVAGSYILAAGASGGNTVGFGLTNHGAASLQFTQQPTNAVSGTLVSPSVAIKILDETGALFSTNATVTLTANGPGGFTGGSSPSVAAVNGVATFNNLTLDTAGRYTVSASLLYVPTLSSQSFEITATHLALLSQPTAGLGGIITAVVAAEDVLGNVDPDFQGAVTLTIASGGGGLNGVMSESATGGIAAFAGLTPTMTALDSTLTASAPSLTSATSADFNLVVVSSIAPIAAPNPIYGAGPNSNVQTAIVRGLYRTILGRDADASGLQLWAGQLAAGVSSQTIATDLLNSGEHRGQEIDQFYLTFLHRPSDPAGRAAWLQLMAVTGSETAVVAAMLASQEYLQNHSGRSAWITAVYDDVLGRAPGGAELQYWLNQLAVGATMSQVAQAVVSSTESNARVLGGYYAAILHRSADAAGELSWLNLLATGQSTTSSAAAAFFASPEFYSAARATL